MKIAIIGTGNLGLKHRSRADWSSTTRITTLYLTKTQTQTSLADWESQSKQVNVTSDNLRGNTQF